MRKPFILSVILFGILAGCTPSEPTKPIEGTVFGKEFIAEECDYMLVPVNNMLIPVETCEPEEFYLKIREEGSDEDVAIRVTRDDFANYDFGDEYKR